MTPTHHPIKRRLDDGLPAHAIRSTRESLEDVTRTLDAPPSKVLKEQRYIIRKEGSQNKLQVEKIPEGQEYGLRVLEVRH